MGSPKRRNALGISPGLSSATKLTGKWITTNRSMMDGRIGEDVRHVVRLQDALVARLDRCGVPVLSAARDSVSSQKELHSVRLELAVGRQLFEIRDAGLVHLPNLGSSVVQILVARDETRRHLGD
jgi:hypothetical protein